MNQKLADLTKYQVAILATDGVEAAELLQPQKTLKNGGATVKVIGLDQTQKTIQSFKHMDKGPEIKIDAHLSQVSPSDFDALVLPGGLFSPDTLRTNPQVLDFVRAMMAQGKPLGVICHGPQILINAGLVQGRFLTCVPSIREDLKNAGATIENLPVVIDHNWISSRTPEDLPEFCQALFQAFLADQQHRLEKKST